MDAAKNKHFIVDKTCVTHTHCVDDPDVLTRRRFVRLPGSYLHIAPHLRTSPLMHCGKTLQLTPFASWMHLLGGAANVHRAKPGDLHEDHVLVGKEELVGLSFLLFFRFAPAGM